MTVIPVNPKLTVLAHKTYVHTHGRWVVLAVVKNGRGINLKLYKWRKSREGDDRWKVDLSRFTVVDIDLCQIAADAIDFAREYGLPLRWKSLDKLKEIEISTPNSPDCPTCRTNNCVSQASVVKTWRCNHCEDQWSTWAES